MLAGLIGERNSRRPAALDATRNYLFKRLREFDLNPVEYRYQVPHREAVNIEVMIEGRKPKLPCLVIGAHYDTAPTTPGADDKTPTITNRATCPRRWIISG